MADWLVRFRVAVGWASGLLALYLARPTIGSLFAGLGIAAAGELLRLWAAGHLQKFEDLTRSGPYAWTRNPLYLGSAVLGLGFTVATGRPLLVVLWVGLFVGIYFSVMRTEAKKLTSEYPDAYPAYAEEVPLFWPRLRKGASGVGSGTFRWRRLTRNREHHTAVGVLAVSVLLVTRFWLGR